MDDPFLRAHDAHEMNHVDYDDISDLTRHKCAQMLSVFQLNVRAGFCDSWRLLFSLLFYSTILLFGPGPYGSHLLSLYLDFERTQNKHTRWPRGPEDAHCPVCRSDWILSQQTAPRLVLVGREASSGRWAMWDGPNGGQIGMLVQEKELVRVEPGGREEGRREGRSTALLESWLGSASQILDSGVDSASIDISQVLSLFFPFLVLLSQFIFYFPSLRELRYRHLG